MISTLERQVQAAEQEWLEAWKRGPTRLRWNTLPPQVGDTAPDLELQDYSYNAVRLSDFWKERPALILFWRHFGCDCGLERAERLHQEYSDYGAASANVVVVSQGEPERAAAYARKHRIPCAVLCDPSFKAYEAFGLLEGLPLQIASGAPEQCAHRTHEKGVELAAARREAGPPLVDNPWQLPGEFVVDSNGIIRLAYRYSCCEDFPNSLLLIAAIREAHIPLV